MSSLNKLSKMSAAVARNGAPLMHRTHLAAMLLLLCSSAVSVSSYAIELIDDQALSDTTGADGIAVNLQATNVKFDSLYLQDGVSGSGSVLALQQDASLNKVTISPLAATATLNMGTSGGTPALNLNLYVKSLLFAAPTITICTGLTAGSPSGCGTSLGAVALQTNNPTTMSISTTNGFLNSQGTATVRLLLNDANIFFTSNGNQLVTSDIYANISATGKIWVDATDGFRFSTAGVAGGGVTLTAPTAATSWSSLTVPINAGLQASLVMQNGTANTLGATPNGVIAFGASGNLPSLDLYVRGTSATGTGVSAEDNLGDVVGTAGLAARMKATIQTGTGANAFKLYLGAAGANGYGIEMSNFVPFSNVTSATNPTIDTGNVYLNLLTSSTTSLLMPMPLALTNNKGAGNVTTNANNFNLPASDYTNNQDVQAITGSNSLLFAIRGLSIQGVSKNTAFYKNNYGLCTGSVNCSDPSGAVSGFAIMPVLYGVSGNLTLGASSATSLAYSIALAVTGNNGGTTETGTTPSTDVQQSAFFLADTSGATPQYVGLRDINMYFKADGTITFGGNASSNTINLTLPNFLLAMSANFAAGYLPGADTAAGVAPANNFLSNKDTLFTINVGLKSDATFNTNNALTISTAAATPSTLGLSADLTLAGSKGTTVTGAAPDQSIAGSNFFRLVDNSGSALGLDNITGRLQLASGSKLVVGPYANPYTGLTTPANSATLTALLSINPQNIQGNELLTTLNFYPSGGTATPIGKMVLTGGQLISTLTLTPVNH